MGFVANFIRFPAMQKFENRLRFYKVTESLKVGTIFWDTVYIRLLCLAYVYAYCLCLQSGSCLPWAKDTATHNAHTNRHLDLWCS